METKTKGQIEAKISEVITKFKIENIGKGPEEVKSYSRGLENAVATLMLGLFIA